MRTVSSWIRVFAAVFSLAACAGIDKDLAELEGSEPALLLEEQVIVDPSLNEEPFVLPPANTNSQWAQTLGEADHALHHVDAP
ncbi:MAG: hypothetical protein AAF511_01755, partial [Pseudomonadota bacterium]